MRGYALPSRVVAAALILRRIRPAVGLLALILLAGLASGVLSRTAAAQVAAPLLTASDARCWRSILLADDTLCVLQYELPQQTTIAPTPVSGTPEAWCAWLLDRDGCETNPVAPSAPTSLLTGVAYVSLCDLAGGATDCLNGGGGDIIFQDRVPRIWHGLAGVYLNPGAGIWGDADIAMCVESGGTAGGAFSPPQSSCTTVVFNSAANTQSAQRDQFGQDVRAMLLNVQNARNLPLNSYVANNLISAAGRILAVEAFLYAPNIAPDYFQAASALAVTTPFSGNLTPSALQLRLDATATATAWGNFDGLGSEILGISGGFMATLVFLGLGFVVGGVMFAFTQQIPLALAGITSMSLVGMFVGGPTFSAIAVTTMCFAFLAFWFILRRVPTG